MCPSLVYRSKISFYILLKVWLEVGKSYLFLREGGGGGEGEEEGDQSDPFQFHLRMKSHYITFYLPNLKMS